MKATAFWDCQSNKMSYKFLKSRSTKPVVPMPIVFKVFLLHYNHQSCWFLLKRILPFNFTGSGNDEAGNQAYFDKAESLILYYTPRSFEIHIKKKKNPSSSSSRLSPHTSVLLCSLLYLFSENSGWNLTDPQTILL